MAKSNIRGVEKKGYVCSPVPQKTGFSEHNGKECSKINMEFCPAVGNSFKHNGKNGFGTINILSYPVVCDFFQTRWKNGVL